MSTPLLGLRERARVGVRGGGFLGLVAVALGVYEVRRRLPPETNERALMERWRAWWLEHSLRLFEIETVLTGTLPPPPPKGRGRLIVSNHRAALDIGVLLKLFGGSFVSRGDLADWPLLGAAARTIGTIFVDREDQGARVAAARTIYRRLSEGETVLVFPEGTTFEGDEVRPFFPGAFAGLRSLDVEVLPVGIAYPPGCEWGDISFLTHLEQTALRPCTRVAVSIGEVQRADADARKLSSRYHALVQSLVERSRAAL